MTRTLALSSDAGLSLIEVLAAMAVVAVLTGTVVVYMGGQRSEVRETADTLVTRFAEAREFALVSGDVIGFAADPDQRGWQFFHAPDGRWEVMASHPALEAERLPEGVSLFISEGALPRREDADDIEAPEVLFDPTGFDAPFTYALRGDDERFEVGLTEDGALRLITQPGQRAS